VDILDEICGSIEPYVTDMQAVSNVLYVIFDHYSIEKKSTEITEYRGEDNTLLLKKFLVAKKIKGCTDRTLHYYGREIPKILDAINKSIMNIQADDVRIYLAYRMKKVSMTTCNNELRCIRTFCSWLNSEGYLPRNPTVNINTIKTHKKQKEAFTDSEVVRLRDHLATNRDRAMFEILMSTGCRVTELCQIKNEDIEGDTVLVHGKGNKDRNVYLNAAAQYALHNYQNDRSDVSEWLFPRKKDGLKFGGYAECRLPDWWKNPEHLDIENHIDKGTVEHRLRELGRKLGIKSYPHKFRRTCATNALRAGMPIEMVSKMLGHEQISTTQIYLDMKEEDLKAMHQKYVR